MSQGQAPAAEAQNNELTESSRGGVDCLLMPRRRLGFESFASPMGVTGVALSLSAMGVDRSTSLERLLLAGCRRLNLGATKMGQ